MEEEENQTSTDAAMRKQSLSGGGGGDGSGDAEMRVQGENVTDADLANLQRVDMFLQQLPYFEQTKQYAFATFDEIKRNLAESIVHNEIRPGFTHWTNQLIVFIHEYGLFFSKQEHIKLIKLYLNVVQTPDIDLPTIDFCFAALYELLKYISTNIISIQTQF